jgi:hypothetical protein
MPDLQRLMTHPSVGPLTALAFVLIIGTPQRFQCGKQMGSSLGLIACEDSSADRQRFGHISKQGSSRLRFLLVEATQVAARVHPEWRRRFSTPGHARVIITGYDQHVPLLSSCGVDGRSPKPPRPGDWGSTIGSQTWELHRAGTGGRDSPLSSGTNWYAASASGATPAQRHIIYAKSLRRLCPCRASRSYSLSA